MKFSFRHEPKWMLLFNAAPVALGLLALLAVWLIR